jgi:hypothetical protein
MNIPVTARNGREIKSVAIKNEILAKYPAAIHNWVGKFASNPEKMPIPL